jgi:plasmid stability protein
MAQVTVRNLEEEVKARLKRRAVLHGCSLEEEVRRILRDAVKEQVPYRPGGLGSRIAARFAHQGLAEDLPELRGQTIQPADFATE